MNFVSYEFVAFLVVCWLAFLIAPDRMRMPVLLLGSYVFYAFWSIPFLGVLLFTTSVDYFASRIMVSSTSSFKRKAALYTAAGINLLILGCFKYSNFLLDDSLLLSRILHLPVPTIDHLKVILPLGISYFTFEAISYVVDVYRGKEAARNWFEYNFYIMYFPHLVSGPIVRFNELCRQYRGVIQRPNSAQLEKAFELIVLGYLFKVVIADNCAIPANQLFMNPQATSLLNTYAGALAFGAQIYFDFLGYTHIARGVSLLFNIELPINFNHPLLANNMANFWQRWQMSLTRWLYDYVYLPLGGSRKSLKRRMAIAFTTLLIAGIWHGSGWNFVGLGVFYGGCIAFYHAYRHVRKKCLGTADAAVTSSWIYRLFSISLTFVCIVIGGIFFRATDLAQAFFIIGKLTRFRMLTEELSALIQTHEFLPLFLIFLFPFLTMSGPFWVRLYNTTFRHLPLWAKWQVSTLFVVFCWIMYSPSAKTFIYFQF